MFGTLVLGIAMIRRRGLRMIQQIQRDSESGLITQRFLGDDLAVVTSGLLLMVPGLITDCMALLVLIGPLRRWLSRLGPVRHHTEAHFTVKTRSRSKTQDNVTIEGDYRRLDD